MEGSRKGLTLCEEINIRSKEITSIIKGTFMSDWTPMRVKMLLV
jgi:hypothetical protein